MSHDPEAVIANVLRGPLPLHGSPEDHAGRVLDALAAAGYTVTKNRYVQPTKPGMGEERLAAGYVQPDYAGWFAESAIGESGIEPLYRKIEGSTDG